MLLPRGARKLERADRRAVADLTAAIDGDTDQPILDAVCGTLRDLFHADFGCAYRTAVSSTGTGAYVDFYHATGALQTVAPLFESYIARSPVVFSPLYDPLHPSAEQRNVPILGSRILTRDVWDASPFTEHFLRPLGLDRHEQFRVLVCDGDLLLGWVGVFGGTRYGRRERSVMDALVGPLARRMRLDKRLRESAVDGAALEVLLDALAGAAFIVRKDGGVVYANATGRSLLDAGAVDVPARLRAAKAGLDAGVTTRPIVAKGIAAHTLVILDAPRSDLETRLSRAALAWKLTARQLAVLRRVVAGDANKTIAERLRCATVTIEVHVSAILKKANAENRTALVTGFWML